MHFRSRKYENNLNAQQKYFYFFIVLRILRAQRIKSFMWCGSLRGKSGQDDSARKEVDICLDPYLGKYLFIDIEKSGNKHDFFSTHKIQQQMPKFMKHKINWGEVTLETRLISK